MSWMQFVAALALGAALQVFFTAILPGAPQRPNITLAAVQFIVVSIFAAMQFLGVR